MARIVKKTKAGKAKLELNRRVVAEVNRQIDYVRRIIEAHNGSVEIVMATREQLILRLGGNCAGCELAPITYGLVLEKRIRTALPTLKEIRYTT